MEKKRSEPVTRPENGKSKKSKVVAVAVSPIGDAVLFGRVVRLVSEAAGSRVVMTVDNTYNALCAQFPDYRRKPSSLLQKAIGECLRHLRETEPVQRDGDDGDEDEEDEDGDGEEEGRSNLMNTTLRKSYSKPMAPVSAAASAEVVVGKDFEVPNVRYSDVVTKNVFQKKKKKKTDTIHRVVLTRACKMCGS
jgi:hypothetical protein